MERPLNVRWRAGNVGYDRRAGVYRCNDRLDRKARCRSVMLDHASCAGIRRGMVGGAVEVATGGNRDEGQSDEQQGPQLSQEGARQVSH
jgi:hypothetical protein